MTCSYISLSAHRLFRSFPPVSQLNLLPSRAKHTAAMDSHACPSSAGNLINKLTMENNFLRAQVQSLNVQLLQLKAENARSRSSATSQWILPLAQVYQAPSYNTLSLPVAVESLDIMQQHFHRQGTLRHWYDRYPSSH
jgi:hypothetical protein